MESERIGAVMSLVELQLGRPGVQLTDRLVEDLGVESTELVAIVAAIEERFAVEIPEALLSRLCTVEDLVRACEAGR